MMLTLLFAAALSLAPQNETYSPDSSMIAFTRGGDLFVRVVADSSELRLSSDGGEDILNGYASWVYYEEIFGRSSNYRAFWWSPDSRRIAWYRFDNSGLKSFPIVSPFGQYGSLKQMRYPKAGTPNPEVRILIADLQPAELPISVPSCSPSTGLPSPGLPSLGPPSPGLPSPAEGQLDRGSVRASRSSHHFASLVVPPLTCPRVDTPPTANCPSAGDGGQWDGYFGRPFWSGDGKSLYVQKMPRRQSDLELLKVDAGTGASEVVYREHYDTWVDWIDGMLFGKDGLYMARSFETGWEQIYYLSYDGKTFRRLSDGQNWDIALLRLDEERGSLWFTARRDSRIHPSVYRMDGIRKKVARGKRMPAVTALTDPAYFAQKVRFVGDSLKYDLSTASCFSGDSLPCPKVVTMNNDGYVLYGLMTLPKDFDSTKRYPVVMEVYGGPGTAYVRDRWKDRDASNRWCWENGIIWMVVDPRTAGENGRKGMDEAFCRMTVIERDDYVAWAKWAAALPFVDGSRIGLDGFSFGGTTTAMLVLTYPQYFRCGIAGGGVYDWTLYDTHYTERFMDTPQANPGGYDEASVMWHVRQGHVSPDYRPGSLKLTHGTGDDNVHLQNTLQLMDELQKAGIRFQLMLYPDGMHGYRGAQHEHDAADAAAFWREWLL